MASFSISYQTALNNNIRYMYSYERTKPLYRKQRPFNERVPPTVPLRKRYPRRYYDLYEDYNIGIPRAPAFREVHDARMEKIIARLRKPITCQSKSGRNRCREKIEGRNCGHTHAQENTKMTKEEMDAITKRLLRETECLRQRHAQRDELEVKLPPINLRNTVGLKKWMN